MQAGRILDEAVAEQVMGYVRVGQGKDQWGNRHWPSEHVTSVEVPHYSTSVAQAWEVMHALELSVMAYAGQWLVIRLTHTCDLPSETTPWLLIKEQCSPDDYTIAETVPLAICLQALKQAKDLQKERDERIGETMPSCTP